jgi:peptide deformylase
VKQTEASLSFPSIRLQVERPASIKVSYVDALGKSHQCEADGLLARVIKHQKAVQMFFYKKYHNILEYLKFIP